MIGIVKTLVVTSAMLIGVALVGLLVVLPRVTDTVPLTVYTGSMEPGIPAGAVVLVERVDSAKLQAGDVITYQTAPGVDEYITHRIVRVQPETDPPSFVTKGDANRGADIDPVPVGAVRGEVWFDVPYVGQVSDFIRSTLGIALLAVLAGVLLLVNLLSKIFRRPEGDNDGGVGETKEAVADDETGSADLRTAPTEKPR